MKRLIFWGKVAVIAVLCLAWAELTRQTGMAVAADTMKLATTRDVVASPSKSAFVCPVHGRIPVGQVVILNTDDGEIHRYCLRCIAEYADRVLPQARLEEDQK